MSWKNTGSISDRLRSLELRSHIIAKSNDPMTASYTTQIPMNTPGPNGFIKEEMGMAPQQGGVVPDEFKGAGLSQGAPLSMALNGLKEAYRITDAKVMEIKSILAQYGNEGVLSTTYQGLLDNIHQYHSLMDKMEQGLTKLIQDAPTQALVNNDPAQSVNQQGNADMVAMQGGEQGMPQGMPQGMSQGMPPQGMPPQGMGAMG